MNKIAAAASLCVSGFYIFGITRHMVHPGANTDYTRMLMFVCLATIPLSFMMVFVGGRERWPLLAAQAKAMATGGLPSLLLLAGLVFLLLVMPLGMVAGVWYGMGLRFGLLFLIYFVPVILRLVLSPAQAATRSAVTQALLLFASFFIGLAVVWLLGRFAGGAELYKEHLQVVWPDYGDADVMFFSVCSFTLLNQVIEFVRAIMALFGLPGSR